MPSPLELPEGPLEDRLTAFLDWLRGWVSFEHAYVVDEEGLALVHESAHLELIAASSTLAETWETLYNRFGLARESFLSVDLAESRQLHLITEPTRWGRVSLGVVLEAAHPAWSFATARDGFRRALADKEPHGS